MEGMGNGVTKVDASHEMCRDGTQRMHLKETLNLLDIPLKEHHGKDTYIPRVTSPLDIETGVDAPPPSPTPFQEGF